MPASALVTALVTACIGPMCSYTAVSDLASVRQCERMAPFIAGLSRSQMTALLFTPVDMTSRLAFRCLDARTGTVLMSYDSDQDELALDLRR